ncbi:uncharacterized protein LOC133285694 [Gastrolobium bilobum]|uniref:uncharacterized protein LOC133285694 n=1 Tax=Gastrolobium bilobum TaxID=150636 RepID=UPI002AB2FDA6|nr:uncharacterized protein LOC133285694 [Gastrolobium bilobum]
MNGDERKRRFNEAIVNMLYHPSPTTPRLEQESEPVEALIEGSGSDVISGTLDEYENATTSGDEEQDSETERLTRAQRKRIRKKKLKEEATRRGRLIGPLLSLTPTTTTQCGDHVAEDAPGVRSNASEEGDELACANSKKMKHRRMAKKLAKEKRIAPTLENCNQSSGSSSALDLREARI